MAKKVPNQLTSLLTLKCPRCREGNLFVNRNIYRFSGFFDMPEQCPNCGQKYELEVGFYYGAMYVSYGLTIALNVAIFVALVVFDSFSIPSFLIAAGVIGVLVMPYIFKLARSIWLSLYVKYDPELDR